MANRTIIHTTCKKSTYTEQKFTNGDKKIHKNNDSNKNMLSIFLYIPFKINAFYLEREFNPFLKEVLLTPIS